MKKEIYFSIAEKEIIEWMVRQVGTPRLQAIEHVLAQKRELAYIHGVQGNIALRRQILQEINEWDEEAEKEYQRMVKDEESYRNSNNNNS